MNKEFIIIILSIIVSSLVGYLFRLFGFGKWIQPVEAPDQPYEPLTVNDCLQSSILTYGEPDHIIVANATRANEAKGAILVYDSQGYMLYDHVRIDKKAISEITFHNAASPYEPNNYQIVIKTTLPDKPTIYIPTGSDITWTQDVLVQIKSAISI